MVEGTSFLIWASTHSFDSLTCGVLKRWLAEGDEVLSGPPEGSSQLSPCSSRQRFFCISPAGRSLGSELSHRAALARSCSPRLSAVVPSHKVRPGLCPEELRAAIMTDPSPHPSLLRPCFVLS